MTLRRAVFPATFGFLKMRKVGNTAPLTRRSQLNVAFFPSPIGALCLVKRGPDEESCQGRVSPHVRSGAAPFVVKSQEC